MPWVAQIWGALMGQRTQGLVTVAMVNVIHLSVAFMLWPTGVYCDREEHERLVIFHSNMSLVIRPFVLV